MSSRAHTPAFEWDIDAGWLRPSMRMAGCKQNTAGPAAEYGLPRELSGRCEN